MTFSAATIDEFANYLEKSPFCHSTSLLKDIKNKRYTYLADKINSIDIFFRVERYTWGLEKHISYPKLQWKQITSHVYDELKTLGHQADAGYLFSKVKDKFFKLRSKYELVQIIKSDRKIRDLGFLNFYLSDSYQKERITVEQVIQKIFNENWRPKHYDELVSLIQENRTYRKEGVSVLHRQSDFLKLYRPGYYGLRTKDAENLEYLHHHVHYIENFISYRQKDTTFVEEVMEDMSINYDKCDFLRLLKNSKSITLVDFNDDCFIINKNWGIVRILITILANTNKPMFFDQLKIIAINKIGLHFNEKKLRYKFDEDIRVTKLQDNSYVYNEIIASKENYASILDEIEEYLIMNPQVISVIDLFRTVSMFSENSRPSTESDLLTLVSIDNRFTVLKGKMISLI